MSQIDDLPPLRDVIARYDLRAIQAAADRRRQRHREGGRD
jgi:hypothetical protein